MMTFFSLTIRFPSLMEGKAFRSADQFVRGIRGNVSHGIYAALLVGGEECFCARRWTARPLQGDFGVLDRPAIERGAVKIKIAQEPTLSADHTFSTGKVPQTTFEKLLAEPNDDRDEAGVGLLCRELSGG